MTTSDTPTETRAELEAHLLGDPFDDAARERYAELLEIDDDLELALAQWELISRARSADSGPRVRAARCLLQLERLEDASQKLDEARACPDFDPSVPHVVELDASMSSETEEASKSKEDEADSNRVIPWPGGGHALPGGRQTSGEVVSLSATDSVRFSDILGMEKLKKTIRLSVIEPFLRPGLFERFKKKSGGGVLLYGPPGCGKTMMARAIATECDASFTAVGISDILNLWCGQSEQNLASVFELARSQVPAVLFFDELDALAFSRAKARSETTRTLVNEFLAQLDGMGGRNDRVLVLGATNMPWDVDDAMKRPGRFDRQIFVPPPDTDVRSEMLRHKLIGVPCDDLDFADLAGRCRHFSGADLDGVLELAKEAVLTEILESGEERPLRQEDFALAIEDTVPSTLEWLKTVRNVVKFGGGGRAYRDVEKYLRRENFF